MPTRGFYGLVVDDKLKITYAHSDSMPDWLGVRFLGDVQALLLEHDHASLRRLARSFKVVDEDRSPTEKQRDQIRDRLDIEPGLEGDWYSALREIQGEFARTLRAGFCPDASWFPVDSLSCEWGYLLDIDERAVEVYKGMNKLPPKAGRWKGVEPERESLYYPVTRVERWDLDDVPGLTPAHMRVLEYAPV